MKKVLFSISAVLLFTTGNAIGETHYVLPGDRIQTAVDQAENGDTVVVLGGEYPHDVIITKNIKFKKIFGEAVSINGDLKIEGLTEHFELSGFTLRGDTENNWDVYIRNCKSISLVNLIEGTDHIVVDDTKLICKNSNIQKLELGNCVSELINTTLHTLNISGNKNNAGSRFIKCYIKNWLNIYDGPDQSPHVFYQNKIMQVHTHGNPFIRLIFAYNKTRAFIFFHRGDVRLIGNIIDGFYNGPDVEPQPDQPGQGHHRDRIMWDMRNSNESRLYAFNNIIRNSRHDNSNGLRLYHAANTSIKIYNNIIYNIGNNAAHHQHGMGVDMSGGGWALNEIKGNFFYKTGRPVHAGFDSTKVHHNFALQGGDWEYGGYRGFDNVHVQGLISDYFVDFQNENFRLKAGSQLIDAGPEEPWHFDLDGSRNDIGIYGGSSYNPDGLTTENPVVLFSEQEPLQLIKGKTKEISISAGSIVAP